MFGVFGRWIAVRRRNGLLLHRLADVIRDECEATPYKELSNKERPVHFEREIDGVHLVWSEEISARRAGGGIRIDLDFFSDLPTLFGAKPARSFWKYPDESVVRS